MPPIIAALLEVLLIASAIALGALLFFGGLAWLGRIEDRLDAQMKTRKEEDR